MPQLAKVRMINPTGKKFSANRVAKRKAKSAKAKKRSLPKFLMLGGNPERSNMAKKKKAKRPGKNYSGKKRGFSAKAKGKNPAMGKKRKFRKMRNPLFPVSGREMLYVGGGAVGGGLGARLIPENLPFLSKYNTGVMGYGLNLLTTFALAKLGRWAMGDKVEEGVWVGGILMTASRFVSDRFGKTVVSFGNTHLGYDPAFRLRGLGRYQADNLPPLPVPTSYPASGPTPPLPVGTSLKVIPATAASSAAKPAAPQTTAAASSMGYMGSSRYGRNRFSVM